MVNPENIDTNSILWIELVIFRNIYTHTHTLSDKEAMNLKKRREGSIGGLCGRRGNRVCFLKSFNTQKKE